MAIKEKLLNLETVLIGNRGVVLGISLAFGGTFAMYNEVKHVTPNLFLLGSYFLTAFSGAVVGGYNNCGEGTVKIYQRTVEHLKEFRKIDKRFLLTCMEDDANKKYTGYCQLQGIYLACRDYAPECLPEFYELKKQYTKNIVPNF